MTWHDRAACLSVDPELFFPIGTTGPALPQIEEAKAVCHRCEVIDRTSADDRHTIARIWALTCANADLVR